jgi:ankyrin repeat protein
MADRELKALLRSYLEEDTYSFEGFDELEVNSVGREQESVLHMICRRDATEEAKLLILHGANVNAQTDIGTTPLHTAATSCNIELARSLLQHGAFPDTQDSFGNTAESIAIKSGCSAEFLDLLRAKFR